MNKDELKLKTDQKLGMKVIMKRNMKYIKPHLFKFIVALVLILINVGISLIMPSIIGNVTGELSNTNGINIKYVYGLVIFYFVIREFHICCCAVQLLFYVSSSVL